MKTIAFYLGILSLVFVSCEESNWVKFESPQPLNVKEIKSFGKEVQGVYTKFSNPNKSLIIHPEYITTELHLKMRSARLGIVLDSNTKVDINNDSALIAYFEKKDIHIKLDGDTIVYNYRLLDTLFYISEENILKKYKRNYFLNYKFDTTYWRVKKTKVRGDTLSFGEIFPTDSLLHYDYASIDTAAHQKTAKAYILSPSKSEFKKLLRSKAFSTTEKYVRKKELRK